ncbi:MAG TPA: toll/interleukin-1 receptor domain-containing protein [Thermoanaerobaculia bacterium]|nr:toll/interleukin-1 receptor domain-containing protein [Thermoanaerobaculia bacterium]
MDKAFLCHSSNDKPYVERVAKRLGRAKVVFDAMSFAAGHDFRREIEAGLDASALFVFFVSRASLSSTWCKFEVDEAHFRMLNGEIRGQIAVIIDPAVKFGDLPKWMQRLRAIVQPRPVQAAREIERELFAIAPTSLAAQPFVGRQQLQREFVEKLAVRMESGPRIFIVSGLEGVGRRSYLARVLQDNLGLTLGPYRVLDTTSTFEDLFIWLLDETADVMTRQQLASEATIFRGLDQASQVAEVVNRLRQICEGRFVPALIDRGGILQDNGQIKEPYASVVQAFAADTDAYITIIDTRAPQVLGAGYADRTLQQRIDPLRPQEALVLLHQLMRHESVSLRDADAEELTEYIDGYPPAAYFVARQAKTYGIAATLADKSLLADFKARRFTRFLLNLRLLDAEWNVLTYLASEQSVPLTAVAVALARDAADIAQVVRKLIDNSLIIVADDNLAVSPPVRDAITRAKGHLSVDDYGAIRERLTKVFWADAAAAPSIEVVDATLHAVARSGSVDFDPYKDLVRVSVVHRLARESYYRRDYGQALEYAKRAESMGANNHDIRAIHFKALVRLEKWPAAAAKLDEIRERGDREYLFLKGFMFRRQRKFDAAREAYEAAFRGGDNSFALHRDYADCLHRLGRLKEATAQIRSILNRQTENIFVLDLALRIYVDGTKSGEDVGMPPTDVQRYLADLDRFDVDRRFIHHRRATLFAAQEEWERALEAADAACAADSRAFEAFALRIDILIEMGRFREAAEALASLASGFDIERDVQIGLRVKLATREGRWRDALAEWNTLRDKQRAVAQGLLLRIKDQQAQDSNLSLSERAGARTVAEELRGRISLPRPSPVLDAAMDYEEPDLPE